MKRFFSLIALMIVAVSVTPIVEAKKFGGGKSFGKSFKTAPKQQNTNTLNQQKNNKNNAANPTSNRKGLMGGILGGLLAGGLLAAFFGGAFDGIQFMDILIIGLIAFVTFKFLRGMLGAKQSTMNQQGQQPAFGNSGHDAFKSHTKPQQPQSPHANFEQANPQSSGANGGFGGMPQSSVPHNYPPGFDHAEFINGSREHYRVLQGAWNFNQLDTIQEYVSASLFEDLKSERAKLSGEQHTDVMYVDAEIVRADYDADKAQLSLQFSGRYRDGAESVEEEINDIWHLERDLTVANAPWLIVGIQG